MEHARFSLAYTIVATCIIVTGCSGSGGANDSQDLGTTSITDSNAAEESNANEESVNNPEIVEDIANPQQPDNATADAISDATTTIENSAESSSESAETNSDTASSISTTPTIDTEAVPDNTSVPDPLVQNTTQVVFDITVPAFMSNALLVQLRWGDIETNAAWVGGEFWSTTLELPTATEETLNVTFFDDNGAVELASFEQTFRTGTNAAETFTITTDQFDASLFDTDQDGVSNLDELIAGTDPSVDEDSLLEIRDSFSVIVNSRTTVSRELEAAIGTVRPFFDEFDTETATGDPNRPLFMVGSTNIDANGNGTYSLGTSFGSSSATDAGTRTRSDNSRSCSCYMNCFLRQQLGHTGP